MKDPIATILALGPQNSVCCQFLTQIRGLLWTVNKPESPDYLLTLDFLSAPLFLTRPLSFHFSLALGVNATRLLDKSEVLETHRYVAGLLHAFCCLSRKFAIWGVSLKPGLCSDSQVQAYPGSPSSVLGKKWRTFLDACLMCNQLLMLIRRLQQGCRRGCSQGTERISGLSAQRSSGSFL